MSKQLEILVGISGSGKSTYAHKMWENNPNDIIIVNRDKIRELLFGYTEHQSTSYYLRKDLNSLEKQVSHYEELLIKEGLSKNKHVIVDATHLKLDYIHRYRRFNVPTKLTWFDIELNKAVDRISRRPRHVDITIILSQYDKYKNLKEKFNVNPKEFEFTVNTLDNDSSKPRCVIFDIDGTLAHHTERNIFEWDKVDTDLVDVAVGSLYEELCKIPNLTIIICSGRDSICLEQTTRWFDNNFTGGFDFIYMRNNKDNRPDWQVKYEMWKDICKNYYISYIIDDRCQVVDYARSLGLKVFQVEYNNF